MRAKKKILLEFDYQGSQFIVKEVGLPLPYVHYSQGGPFLGFSFEENSQIFLCSCFKKAFETYIASYKYHSHYTDPLKEFIISSFNFPYDLSASIYSTNRNDPINHIHFKDKICHQCNCISPTVTNKYCSMSKFELEHHWYIKKYIYEISSIEGDIIWLPTDIQNIYENQRLFANTAQSYREQHNWSEANKYDKLSNKLYREWHNFIENHIREAFNYPLIGEKWQSETALYLIISCLFPQCNVIHHYKPDFLQGLEFDIFIEEIQLGIEYQGEQHFKPIAHWGGEEAFEKLKERDNRKKVVSEKRGINLIYFTYEDEINEVTVKERLKPYLID